MMQASNLDEYADPALYDAENDEFEPDGPFYLTLAQRSGGAALELGCGTGRITIPMAERGIPMTGLDITPEMLAQAANKAPHLPVNWIEADARAFRLEKRFRLIFETGATFQHMLTRADQEAMLARVREHLEPDGMFAVGAMFPTAGTMESDPEEKGWFSYTTADGREVSVSGTQHYDALRQVTTETAYRRWRQADGQEAVRIAPLTLRQFFPQELEALLHYNGFRVVEQYGDYDFSPLTAESPHILYVCQRGG